MKVVAAGECCLDYYEGESESRLGGITFNFALHAAQAFPGAEIHLLSAVGEDARAAFVASSFQNGLSPETWLMLSSLAPVVMKST